MADLYETDPHAWAIDQADKLRGVARHYPLLGIDFPHLIEELDGMASTDRQRVEALARLIIQHLLLLEFSPARAPRRGWQAELVEHRTQLRRALTTSLRNHLSSQLDAVYEAAFENTQRKMRLYDEQEAAATLPLHRPYSLEQILDLDFAPERANT